LVFQLTILLFIKLLLGDNSDKVRGVKGLGQKKLLKIFPELAGKQITLKGICDISEAKLKDHVIYARILHEIKSLETNYKIMDLSNPMLDEKDEQYLNSIINSKELNFTPEHFLSMYNQDQLGGIIRNVEFWIHDVFTKLV
jgi:5'-3' exonuclease